MYYKKNLLRFAFYVCNYGVELSISHQNPYLWKYGNIGVRKHKFDSLGEGDNTATSLEFFIYKMRFEFIIHDLN